MEKIYFAIFVSIFHYLVFKKNKNANEMLTLQTSKYMLLIWDACLFHILFKKIK